MKMIFSLYLSLSLSLFLDLLLYNFFMTEPYFSSSIPVFVLNLEFFLIKNYYYYYCSVLFPEILLPLTEEAMFS